MRTASLRRIVFLAVPALALASTLFAGAQEPSPAPITYQDLLDGLKNPARWLTFSGDYSGQRAGFFSPSSRSW